MTTSWKRSHPVQPFSPRQIQLHYVIPDIFVLSVLNDCQRRNSAISQSRLFQCFTIFSIWRFPLLSNLKFFLYSTKPLISCTTHHGTENALCPFSLHSSWNTEDLSHPLLIFLFFRLNNSVSSDLFSTVILLRYQIALSWTRSSYTHCALLLESDAQVWAQVLQLWSRRAASRIY